MISWNRITWAGDGFSLNIRCHCNVADARFVDIQFAIESEQMSAAEGSRAVRLICCNQDRLGCTRPILFMGA